MSNNDSFIDEVTEEVRRDRLFALMRKYGWIGILAIVLIVGGTAWNEWQKRNAQNAARAFGDAVAAAMASNDAAERAKALEIVKADPSQSTIVDLLASGEFLSADDKAAAVEQLKAITENPATPETYRQLALLKRVLIEGNDMPPADRDAILDGLAQPGAPFRPLAMEQQALALVQAGKTDDAIALSRRILEEPTVTAGLRRRAAQLIVALGGDPSAS